MSEQCNYPFVLLRLNFNLIPVREVESVPRRMAGEDLKSASVSPSLQICLLQFVNVSQFSVLGRQVALCLLKYFQFHREFVSVLSNLSRSCLVRSKF